MAPPRSVVASFRDRAQLRRALNALVAAGFEKDAFTYVAGPEALKSWKLPADRPAADPMGDDRGRAELPTHFARRLAYEIADGAVALFVRVADADAEKRASMILLRHGEGAVQVHDLTRRSAPDQAAAAS